MNEPNRAEAAASSPSPYLTEAMLRAQANPDCAFPDAVQVLSQEVLRMRAQCPPTAEVEKLRAELATAKDDVKRLRDEKRDQIAATVEHLRRAGIIVGSPTAGPTPGVAIGEPMTLASTIGMLCDERAKVLAGLGREAKALLEASFMLRCAEGGRPLPAPRVEETFGIFEALRKVIAERDALISAEAWAQQMGRQAQNDRDAWKHKADTLGGDLNRIRALVLTASDEQTTFDAVKTELQRLRAEAAPFGSSKQFAAETGQAAKHKRIVSELAQVVNRYSLENVCGDTPDFLIAELMLDAAMAFGKHTRGREAHATGGRMHVYHVNFGGSKVGPATGQPRTEAPLAADGSGTVVELGEAFRLAMQFSSKEHNRITGDGIEARIHFLREAVAELAKVVERMGAR